MKSLTFYLDKARKGKFAIGQFNFSAFSEVKGIVQAAQNLKAPIILGTSESESKFFGLQEAVAIRNVLREKTSLPIFLNLDHGKSFEYVKEAMEAGYDMVHFDGSKLPLEENIKITNQVVKFAKWKNILVEGEVGKFGTDASMVYDKQFEIKEEDLTSVQDAEVYYKKTKVDLLAINIGTFHGVDTNTTSPSLRLERLREIAAKVDIPFVLHGGSGTPQGDLKAVIQGGIVKININTDLRVAFTNALRTVLEERREEVIPYKYLPAAVDAVKWTVENSIRLFDSDNQA